MRIQRSVRQASRKLLGLSLIACALFAMPTHAGSKPGGVPHGGPAVRAEILLPDLTPPAEWGVVVTILPTVMSELFFVRTTPLLNDSPESAAFLQRLEQAISRGDDTAFENDPYVQGKVVTIASLWRQEANGYRLLAASADSKTDLGWTKAPLPLMASELAQNLISAWRARLLELIATAPRATLLEAPISRDVRHYGEVTDDPTVDRAWSDKLNPTSCIEDSDNRKQCGECCDGKTTEWRNWCFLEADAAGDIVGGLGGEQLGRFTMGYARVKCIEAALQRLQVCHFGCRLAFHFCIGIDNPGRPR